MVQRDATTLDITELPIRKWTQDYKEMLEGLVKPEDRTAPALIEVRWIAMAGHGPPKIQLLVLPQQLVRGLSQGLSNADKPHKGEVAA